MTIPVYVRTYLAASVCGLALCTQTFAQTEPQGAASTDVIEIVITAQRRAESIQNVPIAVSVISGDQLANQGVQEIADLGRVAASLQMANTPGSSGGGGYIRGVGTYARFRGAEPSVGIIVDGVVQGLIQHPFGHRPRRSAGRPAGHPVTLLG